MRLVSTVLLMGAALGALGALAALPSVMGETGVRADPGPPPPVGPVDRAGLTTSTGAYGVDATMPDDSALEAWMVSTSACDAALAQAAAEIAWWRSQVAATPPAAPRATTPPPLIGPVATPGLPSPASLVAASGEGGGAIAGQDPAEASALGGSALERPRLSQVAALLKDMKPPQASQVVAGLDEALAVAALSRMPPRSSSAILAALPPELAARLLTRLSLLPATQPPPQEAP